MEVPSGKNLGKTINSYKRIINLASIILFSSLFTINTFAQFIDQLTLDNVSASKNTGEKPQSKVWKHDNIWWAVIPTSSGTAGTFIYKLVGTSWVKGLSLSTGTNFQADTKNVGDITYILLFKDGTSKFKTVTYDSGTETYSETGTTDITLSGVETATIDIDSNNRMWLAYESSNDINVQWSDSPYSTWNGPLVLESSVLGDDIAAVTAFTDNDGSKIGVLWSDQTNIPKFGFRYHNDNDNVNTWSTVEVASGSTTGSVADDHINFAVESNGTIYVAVKTSYNSGSEITIGLLVRENNNWDLYGVTNGSGTRPIAVLDESNDKIFVIYTKSSTSDNDMVYNYSNTSNISFSSQNTLEQGSFNNVTSTKQSFTDDVVILYEDGNSWSGVIAGTQPLPVELAFFSGVLNGNKVELNWRTETEVDNYGFNIENAIDNGDWSNIGFVEGHGNSNSPKYYDYSDYNINGAGEYHYRLKQTDNDGTFEYSDIVTVQVATPMNFYLSQNYPNPFNPTTRIDFSLPERQMVSLRIYNTLGELVSELVNEIREPGSYSVTFDASNLPSGVYFYRLQTSSFAANKKMTILK